MAAAFCSNHPGVATDGECVRCCRPFCPDCLLELRGERLCGWCRDADVARLSRRRPLRPENVVLMARLFDWAMILLGAGYALFNAAVMALIMAVPGPSGSTGQRQESFMVIGVMVTLFGTAALAVLGLYLPPALGLGPGRRWAWRYQLVAAGAGVLVGAVLFAVTCIPMFLAAIGLLIYWLRPEVREYCGVER